MDINQDLTNKIMQMYGKDNFENLAKQFSALSAQDKQMLFQQISNPVYQQQIMQYFQNKGVNLNDFMNQQQIPTQPRKYNY